jgi:hypothetical protein
MNTFFYLQHTNLVVDGLTKTASDSQVFMAAMKKIQEIAGTLDCIVTNPFMQIPWIN